MDLNWKKVENCAKTGYEKACTASETSCMIQVRKRDGYVNGYKMGCKQPQACHNNKLQNFAGDYSQWQCKTGKAKPGPSVCTQCCQNGDSCFGNANGYKILTSLDMGGQTSHSFSKLLFKNYFTSNPIDWGLGTKNLNSLDV